MPSYRNSIRHSNFSDSLEKLLFSHTCLSRFAEQMNRVGWAAVKECRTEAKRLLVAVSSKVELENDTIGIDD